MSEVSIGMGIDEETGDKVVHLCVQGEGVVVFGSEQAILYGRALMDFGHAAGRMNVEEE